MTKRHDYEFGRHLDSECRLCNPPSPASDDAEKAIDEWENDYIALRERIRALAEAWERYPCYGPVDGTGRHDPDGWDMFDVPRDNLIAELRALLGDA